MQKLQFLDFEDFITAYSAAGSPWGSRDTGIRWSCAIFSGYFHPTGRNRWKIGQQINKVTKNCEAHKWPGERRKGIKPALLIWGGGYKFAHVCLVTRSCLTLCRPMDYSPPGSSVHRILQARILEQVAISYSRGSFLFRDWTCVSYLRHW